MQEWVPVCAQPFKYGKQIPVGELQRLATIHMCAQVHAANPDLERSPALGHLERCGCAVVRIMMEGNSHRERGGVASKPFPADAHLLRLLARFTVRCATAPSSNQSFRMFGGTSPQSMG